MNGNLKACLVLATVAAAFLGQAGANAQVIYSPDSAYTPGYTPGPPVTAVASPDQAPVLSAAQIDSLTGPIALYPDPLLAVLLPAATYPDDIIAAAQWMAANPQPTEDAINLQPWDSSVKAIVHYPTVLQQLATNIEWTQALGAAFVNQQQDVMDSIQRLREAAIATGALGTNAQQIVEDNNGVISILPAQAQVVFVPAYDPEVVYIRRAPLTFSLGLPIGGWLNLGFDWGHHWITRDRDWRRYQPGHHFQPRPEITIHQWVRDDHRPAPRLPAKYIPARPVAPVRPGYERPAPARPSPAFDANQQRAEVDRERARGLQSDHAVVRPAPAAPARPAPAPVRPAPAPHVVAPEPARPAPAPHVVAPEPARPAPAPHVVAPAPRVAAPAPRAVAPAPAAHNAPAFRPDNGAEVSQQSDRGHQSLHR